GGEMAVARVRGVRDVGRARCRGARGVRSIASPCGTPPKPPNQPRACQAPVSKPAGAASARRTRPPGVARVQPPPSGRPRTPARATRRAGLRAGKLLVGGENYAPSGGAGARVAHRHRSTTMRRAPACSGPAGVAGPQGDYYISPDTRTGDRFRGVSLGAFASRTPAYWVRTVCRTTED